MMMPTADHTGRAPGNTFFQLSTPTPTCAIKLRTSCKLHHRRWRHLANKLKTYGSDIYLRDFTLSPLLMHLMRAFRVIKRNQLCDRHAQRQLCFLVVDEFNKVHSQASEMHRRQHATPCEYWPQYYTASMLHRVTPDGVIGVSGYDHK